MIKKSFLNGWRRIGIFLLLVPIFAKADWTKIVTTADQTSPSAAEYSIDISTVLKDKGYTRVWVLANYNNSQLSKVNYQNYYSASKIKPVYRRM